MQFRQQLGTSVLPVAIHSVEGHPVTVGMTQSAPTYGTVVSDREALAAALGLEPANLLSGELPAQVVATDVAHLLVPVQPHALSRARPDPEQLAALVRAHGGEGCYLFTTEPRDDAATVDARFFNPGVGIGEDPATGTAAGPLAAYLVRNGAATGPRIVIDQGHETGRPSRLEVHVTGSHIELRGAAVITATGMIRIR
jgi:PhzF family phenazine biosynthesis protein